MSHLLNVQGSKNKFLECAVLLTVEKKYINCTIKISSGKVIEFIGFGDTIFVLKKKPLIANETLHLICTRS